MTCSWKIISMLSRFPCLISPSKAFFCTKPPLVQRAITSHESLGAVVGFQLEGSNTVLTARLHPKCTQVRIPAKSTIYVSKPAASDPQSDHFELIAHGVTGADGKLKLAKYSCVHPDRPISAPEKLCGNCPRRELLK